MVAGKVQTEKGRIGAGALGGVDQQVHCQGVLTGGKGERHLFAC